MSNRFHRILLAGFVGLGLAACENPAAPEAAGPVLSEEILQAPADRGSTITEIVVAATEADEAEFTILRAALEAADGDLVEVLDGRRQFTVFAPTDAAFVDLLGILGVTAEELLGNTELLTAVLLYHVAPGNRDAGDVFESDQIRTLNGGFVFPELIGGLPFIVDGSGATPDAQVIVPDVEASNGVVHVIDQVLVPGEDSEPGEGDEDEEGEEYDEDEEEEEEEEEEYEDEDEEEDEEAEEDDEPTITEIVVAATEADEAQFTILRAALEAADGDLVEVLDGRRQFTVFAPTDAAFVGALGILGLTAEELLGNTELLTAVLLYHVAPGDRDADDVFDSDRIRTLNGGFVFPELIGGLPFIVDGSGATPDAQVIVPDVEASNGVVHVIDQVLLP